MAKKEKSRPQRMTGQDSRSEGMYNFTGSTKKGTARMDPTDFKVMRDIDRRDRKDIDGIREKARKGQPVSKIDKMTYKDAAERQNRLGARTSDTVSAVDTGKGFTLKEGKERNARLKKLYGVSGKPKKYAKGGKIDGCVKKGHTKGRMR